MYVAGWEISPVIGLWASMLGEVQDTYGPGRVMWPNRDVRFSADKSLYKTTASMWAGDVGGGVLPMVLEERRSHDFPVMMIWESPESRTGPGSARGLLPRRRMRDPLSEK